MQPASSFFFGRPPRRYNPDVSGFNDSHGTVQALLLAAAPLAAIGICVAGWKRRPTLKRLAASAAGGAVVAFLMGGFVLHMCHEGQAVHHWSLFSLCGIATVICVTRLRIGLAVTVGWILALVASADHYSDLVHGTEYTGLATHLRDQRRWDYQCKDAGRILGELGKRDASSYPEGPLGLSPFIEAHPEEGGYLRFFFDAQRTESIPLWHSWLTSLYGRKTVPLELWYPGGTLSEAAGRLEYRVKVRSP